MSKRLALLDQLIEKGSTDPFHHYARALELRSLRRPDEALAALVALSGMNETYVPTYLMAAQLAQELGQLEQARSLAAAGLTQAKEAGDAHAESELGAFLAAL